MTARSVSARKKEVGHWAAFDAMRDALPGATAPSTEASQEAAGPALWGSEALEGGRSCSAGPPNKLRPVPTALPSACARPPMLCGRRRSPVDL